MKVLILLLFSLSLNAQTPTKTVVISWVDTVNPVGTTYVVYRANGACGGTGIFLPIATGLTVKTYNDTGVTPGKYCYAATAVFNEAESLQSNTSGVQVRPNSPTQFTAVVQ
jgi:hypothetical protein